MIKPTMDHQPPHKADSKTFTSMIISLLERLQYFSKISLIIWPVIGFVIVFPSMHHVLKTPPLNTGKAS